MRYVIKKGERRDGDSGRVKRDRQLNMRPIAEGDARSEGSRRRRESEA
jgi:hypothetical protein